jgi:hypothetical protein
MGPFVRAAGIAALIMSQRPLGCSSAPNTLVVPAPDDVPIQLATYADHPMRMYVDVQIGSAAPFKAVLDTGSWGLRILEGTVPDSAFANITTTSVSYGYGTFDSAIYIYGVVAFADLTIDKLTTTNPIPLMLVESNTCPGSGTCRTLQQLFSDAPAILGVGMRNTTSGYGIGNPIAQLPGHPPFVIHVAHDAAFLRIGPSPTDALAFKTLQLGPLSGGAPLQDGTPAWNDVSIPACIETQPAGTSYCFPSLWDSGSSTPYVASQEQPIPYTTEFPVGSAVSVNIGPPRDPMGSFQLVVGAYPIPGVDEIFVLPTTDSGYMNLGMSLFLHYDVLFDQEKGVVGLAQH